MDSISFTGCAWLMTYHLGVIKALRIQGWNGDNLRALGASSGSLAAITFVSGIDVDDCFKYMLQLATKTEKNKWGPFGKMTEFVREGLSELLPKDGFKRVAGRLFISVTELPFVQNRLVACSQLCSNKELINIALASCYIPLYYERPVFYGRKPMIDGGITDNSPVIDRHTIRVSPFKKDLNAAHIVPSLDVSWRDSIFPKAQKLQELFDQGQRDGEHFLLSNLGNYSSVNRKTI